MEVASFYSSYRLPSLPGILSNSQIASIPNGEYVDIAVLFPFPRYYARDLKTETRLWQPGNYSIAR